MLDSHGSQNKYQQKLLTNMYAIRELCFAEDVAQSGGAPSVTIMNKSDEDLSGGILPTFRHWWHRVLGVGEGSLLRV